MKDAIPNFLKQLATDEYAPQPYTEADKKVIARTHDALQRTADRYRLRPDHWCLASGTAAGLMSLNDEFAEQFYRVHPEAIVDADAAAASFGGTGLVIDVQTHFVAPRFSRAQPIDWVQHSFKQVMPAWWTEMDDLTRFDLAAYINNVFLETEVAVAILTSNPGLDDTRMLFNDEIMASRALIDRFTGSGRLLHHSIVHVDVAEELAAMPEWLERYKPSAWKVYTPGRIGANGWESGWMLDDETHGVPFLNRVRELGLNRLCIHKGISGIADNGSPRDIGPSARDFPEIDFLVYHSGFEFPGAKSPAEGPYTEATAHLGINRLIRSCLEAGIPKGGNVYPELGTTWFSLIRDPIAACHALGKLIKYFGEDNVIWGSDSIWYGSQQPLIDAFRSIQIPDWMCEKFGYEKLTPQVREKILSRNAARVYGIDLVKVEADLATDDLQWSKLLLEEFRKNGVPGLR